MTIGDSLAQGTQSLSVTPETTASSISARICNFKKWSYQNYEASIPILFDLEEDLFRKAGILTLPLVLVELVAFFSRIGRNMDQWHDRFFASSGIGPNTPEYLDNIAVAGSVVPNLLGTTAEGARNRFAEIYKEINDSTGTIKIDDLLPQIPELHECINYGYVLNPANKRNHNDRTPLDYVALREPENLVVSIGPNHGLFRMGFEATYDPAAIKKTKEAWEELANAMKTACAHVDTVLFSLLPKLSAVSNLDPVSGRPTNGYFKAYRPKLVPTKTTVTGDKLRAFDQKVLALNKEGEQIFRDALKDKVKFIDSYALTKSFDTKNKVRGAQPIPVRDRRGDRTYKATNHSIQVKQRVRHRPGGPPKRYPPRLKKGGLFSMDGMHPSGLGYAVAALEYLRALEENPSPTQIKRLYAEAFLQDRFISKPDVSANDVFRIVDIIRAFAPEPGAPSRRIEDEDTEPTANQQQLAEFLCQCARIHGG